MPVLADDLVLFVAQRASALLVDQGHLAVVVEDHHENLGDIEIGLRLHFLLRKLPLVALAFFDLGSQLGVGALESLGTLTPAGLESNKSQDCAAGGEGIEKVGPPGSSMAVAVC